MTEKDKKETTKPTTQKTTPKKKETPTTEKKTYCYIGPNIPNGSLKQNAILLGSRSEMKERFKEEFEEYPQVERLIVPIEKLAESKGRISTPGNIINKYYQDLISSINMTNKKGV